MTQRNFYQVLGIHPDATQPDIRAAFVRLSKLHHPDVVSDDGDLPRRFQDVQQAYRCLSVRETRAAHDEMLATAEREHLARQRAVQLRLDHYDRRHPRPLPRPYRRSRWRLIAAAAIGVGVLALLRLFG
ncbi:J domain-containing protein [Sphingomonas sp. GB1N7]|uniref:J domain-containing protein n=1 Tax=Parasphingomonas caseinilytica TaxID=3096158 RepID=UPI002FC8CC4A